MKISELKTGQGNVDVEAEVTDKSEAREFNKFGRTGKVATAKIKDDSGEMALTLWNDDVDKVNIGNKVKVSNGFVREFQGEKQLTSGRFGKIEITSGNSTEKPSEEPVE